MVETHSHKQFDITGLTTALSTPILQDYQAFGTPISGTADFSTLPLKSYANIFNGNVTLTPSGMPIVVANKVQVWYWVIVQDATGSRILTLDSAIKRMGTNPILQTAGSSVDVLRLIYLGTTWFCESVTKQL